MSCHLESRIATLAKILTNELLQPTLKEAHVRKILSYLLRLNLSDQARDIFLTTRSKNIKNALRSIKVGGEVAAYIRDITHLVFTSIIATGEDFRQSFPECAMLSSYTVWAITEIERYCEIFRRQVMSTNDFQLMATCLATFHEYNEMLISRGLDVSFYVDRLFTPQLVDSIRCYHSRIEAGLFRKLDEDPWKLVERSMPTPPPRRRDSPMRVNDELQTHQSPLTPSAQFLVECMSTFIQDVGCVVSVDLFQSVMSVISGILECYFDRIADELRSTVTYTDSQTIAMLRNCSHVLHEFFPRLTSHFLEQVHRNTVVHPVEREMGLLKLRLQHLHDILHRNFCVLRAQQVLSHMTWFSSERGEGVTTTLPVAYAKEQIEESALPSMDFMTFFAFLNTLQTVLEKHRVSVVSAESLISSLVEQVALLLDERAVFQSGSTPAKGGLQLLVLEMRFFLEASGKHATETTQTAINNIMERAILHYCKVSGCEPTHALKDDVWFQSHIRRAMVKTKNLRGKDLDEFYA